MGHVRVYTKHEARIHTHTCTKHSINGIIHTRYDTYICSLTVESIGGTGSCRHRRVSAARTSRSFCGKEAGFRPGEPVFSFMYPHKTHENDPCKPMQRRGKGREAGVSRCDLSNYCQASTRMIQLSSMYSLVRYRLSQADPFRCSRVASQREDRLRLRTCVRHTEHLHEHT